MEALGKSIREIVTNRATQNYTRPFLYLKDAPPGNLNFDKEMWRRLDLIKTGLNQENIGLAEEAILELSLTAALQTMLPSEPKGKGLLEDTGSLRDIRTMLRQCGAYWEQTGLSNKTLTVEVGRRVAKRLRTVMPVLPDPDNSSADRILTFQRLGFVQAINFLTTKEAALVGQ